LLSFISEEISPISKKIQIAGRINMILSAIHAYSGKLFGIGDSTPSVFTPINLSNTAFAAACLASFLDLPVPIAETIGSVSE